VNGANVMTRAELLALTHALENQADEGQAVYFDIYIIEVQGNRTPESGQSFQELADAVLANENISEGVQIFPQASKVKQPNFFLKFTASFKMEDSWLSYGPHPRTCFPPFPGKPARECRSIAIVQSSICSVTRPSPAFRGDT
jgi:hypothetical protein